MDGTDAALAATAAHERPTHRLAPLVLGAVGVVFGDIGTSPLYTFQECVGDRGVSASSAANVLGVCSLIFWALTFVVTVKYLLLLMRADNRGEGGIFALLALVPAKNGGTRVALGWVTVLVVAGAALLFGDGIITPAISVLSSLEGLQLATPALADYVVPLTCLVLFLLFAVQKRGTGTIGALFGPVMIVWFGAIAVLGLNQIVRNPGILAALSPVWAVKFFLANGRKGFVLLGSVVLAVTGGEALYADMGHFGRKPIRLAWLGLVFPALVLCYFGQGALVLRDPSKWEQPFFGLAPHGLGTWLLVAIAAPATVIASQALISGVFSLAHQGVQLGLFPRVDLKHTSHHAEGQIYLPGLNWALALACIALVLGFQKSSRLASAYGLAVTGTMAVTSVVFFEVTRRTWKWPLWKSLAVLVLFLSFDLPFLASNLLKFKDGGWLPVLVGSLFCTMMLVWKRGRDLLAERNAADSPSVATFLDELSARHPGLVRTRGTSVFLTPNAGTVPPALLRHIARIHTLSEAVVLVTVITEHQPLVSESERATVVALSQGFVEVVERFGYMERPDVPGVLARALAKAGSRLDLSDATYFLGRETFLASSRGRMSRVPETIFSFLSRNTRSAATYFRIPPEQVIELGVQIDL